MLAVAAYGGCLCSLSLIVPMGGSLLHECVYLHFQAGYAHGHPYSHWSWIEPLTFKSSSPGLFKCTFAAFCQTFFFFLTLPQIYSIVSDLFCRLGNNAWIWAYVMSSFAIHDFAISVLWLSHFEVSTNTSLTWMHKSVNSELEMTWLGITKC